MVGTNIEDSQVSRQWQFGSESFYFIVSYRTIKFSLLLSIICNPIESLNEGFIMLLSHQHTQYLSRVFCNELFNITLDSRDAECLLSISLDLFKIYRQCSTAVDEQRPYLFFLTNLLHTFEHFFLCSVICAAEKPLCWNSFVSHWSL